jgi:hypothetical protein
MYLFLSYNWVISERNGWKDSLKARLSPVSNPRHINSIFTVNTPILYIYLFHFGIRINYKSMTSYVPGLVHMHFHKTKQNGGLELVYWHNILVDVHILRQDNITLHHCE